MHIKRCNIEGFRGARKLSLGLHKQLNVFVGMNGAGKSTILDAVAILLSWPANRIKNPSASGRQITENDIDNSKSSANLATEFIKDGNPFSWNVAKTKKGYVKKGAVSSLSGATEIASQIRKQMTETGEQLNLPLFAYYPVNRAVLEIPLRIRTKHKFDILSAYEDSLTGGANFRTFFEWFREREDLENETLRDIFSAKNSSTAFTGDTQLHAVRMALKSFMPDFNNLTVCRNPLRMQVEKNGEKLTVNQLSDGEKCLMAMIGDMARRMAIANPLLENPLEGEGIFLIDEIDLHLHPKWQSVIVPKLTEVFPNCQFLISTHSPHVITHVKPENLFLLNMSEGGLEVLPANESYGQTAERILIDLMGLKTTRPNVIEDRIENIYDRIDGNELDKALNLLDELKADIGEDPELVRASILIKRKELIGK